MHKKIPKIGTGYRVSAAKIYLYHSTEIAKARPHSEGISSKLIFFFESSFNKDKSVGLQEIPCTKNS